MSPQEMYVCAPTGFIPFWLQFRGYGGVGVVYVVPFCPPEKPVHDIRDHDILRARLVVGDCVYRAHSVFCVPRGRRVHTH